MEERLKIKWNGLLVGNIRSLITNLKFLCSIREHLSEEFKNKIIQDLIDYNYMPSDIFDADDEYNDIIFYISILNQKKYEDILKNKYGIKGA